MSARIVVLDSVTQCQGRVEIGDVLVAGSFAGALSLGMALPFGIRALIAHAAGVGKDEAGISALLAADRLGLPAAAVETMSARIGDGPSVHDDGVIAHVNAAAAALGVQIGMSAREAAHLLTRARAPQLIAGDGLVDHSQRVVDEAGGGRVVCLDTLSFASIDNVSDVLCTGSHGGRVNVETLLRIVKPGGVIANDGGMAKDRSGVSGLALLDGAGVAGATVSALSARIGDPRSTWADGVISAVNARATQVGVAVGQPARAAARRILH